MPLAKFISIYRNNFICVCISEVSQALWQQTEEEEEEEAVLAGKRNTLKTYVCFLLHTGHLIPAISR